MTPFVFGAKGAPFIVASGNAPGLAKRENISTEGATHVTAPGFVLRFYRLHLARQIPRATPGLK
jgi:hypothetical protein